jgi:hypothetical protein
MVIHDYTGARIACTLIVEITEDDDKSAQSVSAGWCSWIQCGDSYDTRARGTDADFCHSNKDTCEGACAEGEGAGATWCTESTNNGGNDDNTALVNAASTAAFTAMGLDVAQMTALGALLGGLAKDSPINQLLETAVNGAFSNGTPTLEALTATMKTTFTSAAFSTLLKDTDGVDAELLAAVNTAVENADESGAAGLALNLAVVAMAAAALL